MKNKKDIKQQNGNLWSNLTEDQKSELLLAYEESFDNNNLLSHELTTKTIEDALRGRGLNEPIKNISSFVKSL